MMLGRKLTDEAISCLVKQGMMGRSQAAFNSWQKRNQSITRTVDDAKFVKRGGIMATIESEVPSLTVSVRALVVNRIHNFFP